MRHQHSFPDFPRNPHAGLADLSSDTDRSERHRSQTKVRQPAPENILPRGTEDRGENVFMCNCTRKITEILEKQQVSKIGYFVPLGDLWLVLQLLHTITCVCSASSCHPALAQIPEDLGHTGTHWLTKEIPNPLILQIRLMLRGSIMLQVCLIKYIKVKLVVSAQWESWKNAEIEEAKGLQTHLQ